jgi:hypothetical protein
MSHHVRTPNLFVCKCKLGNRLGVLLRGRTTGHGETGLRTVKVVHLETLKHVGTSHDKTAQGKNTFSLPTPGPDELPKTLLKCDPGLAVQPLNDDWLC